MKQRLTNGIDTNSTITAFNLKALLEKNLLDTTIQQISVIAKDSETQGKEHYYQTLSKITDILNNSKTDEEIVQKLNKEFPHYK